jgi:hypothetical protein
MFRDLLDFVTIHEFGHGYFYGLLGSNEFEEPMLDEGLNEYWDQRMLRSEKHDLHLTTSQMKKLGIDLRLPVFAYERLGAMTEHPADPIGQNSWNRMSGGSYGTVYSRTATTMRDLEAQVGSPALERAFKLYYARWKFRHPSVADLKAALAEGTGRPDVVDRVFADQVYDVKPVDDRVAAFTSNEVLPQPGYVMHAGRRVELTTKSIAKAVDDRRAAWKKAHPKAKAGEGAFPYRTVVLVRRAGAAVPQTLRVKFADGSTETARFDGDRPWQRFTWTRKAKAVSVELDPDGMHYLDADQLDNTRTLDGDSSVARRLTGQFASAFQTLLAFLVSL